MSLLSYPFDVCNCTCSTSTHATSLMFLKNITSLLFIIPIVWHTGMKKMKERTKTSHWIVDHFSLTFVNLLITSMLNLNVDFRIRGKVLKEYHYQFGIYFFFSNWDSPHARLNIYQPSFVSLQEPQQKNLINPEAYSETCQTSKMKCFAKIVNS